MSDCRPRLHGAKYTAPYYATGALRNIGVQHRTTANAEVSGTSVAGETTGEQSPKSRSYGNDPLRNSEEIENFRKSTVKRF